MVRSGDAEGFLARWSRRKRAAGDPDRDRPATSDGVISDGVASVAERDHAAPVEVPEDLPDPETLTLDSDFTPFMREGVPAPLRQAALRRLWRLDPVFANRDGLAEYDHDYRALHAAVKEVVTRYRIGRGMLAPDPAPPDPAPPDPAPPPGPAPPDPAPPPGPAPPEGPATLTDRDPGHAATTPEADPPAADPPAADPARAGIDDPPLIPAGPAPAPPVVAGAAPDLLPPIGPPKRRRGRAARQRLPGSDPD